jgi:ABC-type transport system substrate-binding protein
MKLNKSLKGILILTSAILISAGCGGGKKNNNPSVIVHELSDSDMLNPVTYSSADASYIMSNMFQSLISIDFKTLELIPVLAVSRPLIEQRKEGGLLITYNIRPEARWDDGKPITAKDMEFTLKVIKNPKVDNARIKPYYEFIDDIKFYDEDPLKFTFICKDVYILAEASSGDFSVLPPSIYDPKGLMSGFTIKQLNQDAAKLENDPKIIEFAKDFNSEKYQREKGSIVGSGPYAFESWITGQKVTLKRKKTWWGDNVKTNRNIFFEANAPELIYQTINDQTTALVALKAGNLDVMHGIKAKDFVALPQSKKITENYNLHTPTMLAYTYLGLNTRLPKFSDKKVRQAMAHLVDVEKIIKTITYGLAVRVVGPIHPSKAAEYNNDLVPYTYDLELAKKMLSEAGWKDSNGDGTIDKTINGEKTEFKIEFTYNGGNDERKAVALMFQEEARKVGIEVNVVPQEWSIYLDNQKNHKFEMFFGAWISSPLPNDHKQIYHTESYNGGSNYVGFGNAESDALIDAIRIELNEQKRNELNKKFQSILYDEVPYIYLYSPKEKIAIHKRFSNAEPSVMRPGFWEAGFKMDPNL